MIEETIEKAALIYTENTPDNDPVGILSFIEGAKSDAARDYWYAKFPKEKKCYHPMTERKHTSDYYFECTVCGYNY